MCKEACRRRSWRAAAEAATRCVVPVYCEVPDLVLFWSDGVVVVSVDGVALDPLPDVLGVALFVPEVPLLPLLDPLEPEESVLGELLDDELPLLL